MAKEDAPNSYNEETGMLEDIEEVRRVGVSLAHFIERMLLHPVLQILLPASVLVDNATMAVAMESMLRPMSQAEFSRLLGGLLHLSEEEIEEQVRKYGLSEVYPMSHPLAAKVEEPTLDPNDPFVKQSSVLSEIADAQAKQPAPPEPHIELPTNMEDFLKGLWDKHDTGENEAGSRTD
jgi:hypothetical protein